MHATGSAHGRTKGLTAALIVKVLAIVAVVALVWLLELQFEIGATALVILHVALAGVLMVIGVRSGILRRRRR